MPPICAPGAALKIDGQGVGGALSADCVGARPLLSGKTPPAPGGWGAGAEK